MIKYDGLLNLLLIIGELTNSEIMLKKLVEAKRAVSTQEKKLTQEVK